MAIAYAVLTPFLTTGQLLIFAVNENAGAVCGFIFIFTLIQTFQIYITVGLFKIGGSLVSSIEFLNTELSSLDYCLNSPVETS